MNDKFDELAKSMAQSVNRRGALKRFGAGVASVVLASVGLTNEAQAGPRPKTHFKCNCGLTGYGCDITSPTYDACITYCGTSLDKHACGGGFFRRALRAMGF